MKAFEIGVNLMETLLISWLLVGYLGAKEGKRQRLKSLITFMCVWAVEFAMICIINSITFFESWGTLSCLVVRFILAVIFLKGGVFLKLWISAICQIVVVLCALVGNVLICYILDYSPMDMILVFNEKRVIGVLFCKLMHFIACAVILKFREKNPIKTRLWYALIIIPVMSTWAVCLMMEIALQYSDVLWQVLAGMLCIVAANILTYYFYTVISREYQNRMRVALLEQEKENAEKHVEQGRAFVEEMRALRHDIKNHLTVLSSHLENGRAEEARDYLKEINEVSIPQFRDLLSSGNATLDAVINSAVVTCNRNGVFLQTKLSPDLRLPVSDSEVAVLLGNLLDNAIEAASSSSARRVTLTVTQRGETVSILVTNSIDCSVLEGNPDLNTTKEDRSSHGIGIKSIKSIVKKYDGIIEFYEENGEFCCHTVI